MSKKENKDLTGKLRETYPNFDINVKTDFNHQLSEFHSNVVVQIFAPNSKEFAEVLKSPAQVVRKGMASATSEKATDAEDLALERALRTLGL